MSQKRVCDSCGRSLDIEDHDNLRPISDLIPPENEHLHEENLCDNCEDVQGFEK